MTAHARASAADLRVLVGPKALCHRYARGADLSDEQYTAVDGVDQLDLIDPSHIHSVIYVRPHHLPRAVIIEMRRLVADLQRLWPITTSTV